MTAVNLRLKEKLWIWGAEGQGL